MKKELVSTIISGVIFFSLSLSASAKALLKRDGDTLLFDFGQKLEQGWIKADENSKYNSEEGYGWSMISFIENETLSGNNVLSDAVKIKPNLENKTEFKIDVTPGIYDISVYSGNIRFMSISLEDHPAIINIEYPTSEARVQIPVTDNQINMRLIRGNAGTDLSIAAMTVKRVSDLEERKKRVFICSDSTAATFYPLFMYQPLEDGYRGGWGQMLANYLSENVYVHNMSSAGQSAKSFIESGRLESTLYFMQEGDYAFISLGINDVNAYGEDEYYSYMSQIIEAIKSKGGIPVIISSPPYLYDFDSDGIYNGADRSYRLAAKELAEKYALTYIDLNSSTAEFYYTSGNEQFNRMYWTAWNGTKDTIHLSRNGAGQLARLIAEKCAEEGFDFVSDKTAESVKAKSDSIRVKTFKNDVYVQNVMPNEQTITLVTNTQRGGKMADSDSSTVTLPAFDVLAPYNTTKLQMPLYDKSKHTFLMNENMSTALEWITE